MAESGKNPLGLIGDTLGQLMGIPGQLAGELGVNVMDSITDQGTISVSHLLDLGGVRSRKQKLREMKLKTAAQEAELAEIEHKNKMAGATAFQGFAVPGEGGVLSPGAIAQAGRLGIDTTNPMNVDDLIAMLGPERFAALIQSAGTSQQGVMADDAKARNTEARDAEFFDARTGRKMDEKRISAATEEGIANKYADDRTRRDIRDASAKSYAAAEVANQIDNRYEADRNRRAANTKRSDAAVADENAERYAEGAARREVAHKQIMAAGDEEIAAQNYMVQAEREVDVTNYKEEEATLVARERGTEIGLPLQSAMEDMLVNDQVPDELVAVVTQAVTLPPWHPQVTAAYKELVGTSGGQVPRTTMEGSFEVDSVGKRTRGNEWSDLYRNEMALRRVAPLFKESYFNFWGKSAKSVTEWLAYAGVPTDTGDQYVAEWTAWKTRSKQAFIRYRKWATGVAGSVKEFEEIAGAFPDPDNATSAAAYKSMLKTAIELQMEARKDLEAAARVTLGPQFLDPNVPVPRDAMQEAIKALPVEQRREALRSAVARVKGGGASEAAAPASPPATSTSGGFVMPENPTDDDYVRYAVEHGLQ